jgi:hypothetical protein
MAAISGAISAYLAEEAACQPAAVALAAPAPPQTLQPWAIASRSQAMQLRLLMQRRALR